MNTLQFVRNFLEPNLLGVMFNGTLYICESLKYCIFMFVFNYFIKQSASLMTGDTIKKWTKFIRILTISSLVVYSMFGLQYLIIVTVDKAKGIT